jgi:hypothetical protein
LVILSSDTLLVTLVSMKHIEKILLIACLSISTCFVAHCQSNVSDSIGAILEVDPIKGILVIGFTLPSENDVRYDFQLQVVENASSKVIDLQDLTEESKVRTNESIVYTVICKVNPRTLNLELFKKSEYSVRVTYRKYSLEEEQSAKLKKVHADPESGWSTEYEEEPIVLLPESEKEKLFKPLLISTVLPAGPAYLTEEGPQWPWLITIGGYSGLIYTINKISKVNDSSPGSVNNTKLGVGGAITAAFWIIGYVVTYQYWNNINTGINSRNISVSLNFDQFSHAPLLGVNFTLPYEK